MILKLLDTGQQDCSRPHRPSSCSVCNHSVSCQKYYNLSFLSLSLHVSALPSFSVSIFVLIFLLSFHSVVIARPGTLAW